MIKESLLSDLGKSPKERTCPDPENCQELHNETEHHYGCECGDCMYEYWLLKR
ncbi:MAG: hypothetical protein ACYS7Y_36365 [Planctomycetota bacterium]|jgi:hypothetical protein